MIKKTVIEAAYHEIEKLIEDEYGFTEFSIPCNEETGNDCALSFKIDGEVLAYEEEDLINRKQEWRTRLYMNDLCRKGKIEAGQYLIIICW